MIRNIEVNRSVSVEVFPVKYCLDCSSVWEIVKKKKVAYYSDFPSYGLDREICKNCK